MKTSNGWYYRDIDGKEVGPVSENDIESIASGAPETLVRHEYLTRNKWQSAATIFRAQREEPAKKGFAQFAASALAVFTVVVIVLSLIAVPMFGLNAASFIGSVGLLAIIALTLITMLFVGR